MAPDINCSREIVLDFEDTNRLCDSPLTSFQDALTKVETCQGLIGFSFISDVGPYIDFELVINGESVFRLSRSGIYHFNLFYSSEELKSFWGLLVTSKLWTKERKVQSLQLENFSLVPPQYLEELMHAIKDCNIDSFSISGGRCCEVLPFKDFMSSIRSFSIRSCDIPDGQDQLEFCKIVSEMHSLRSISFSMCGYTNSIGFLSFLHILSSKDQLREVSFCDSLYGLTSPELFQVGNKLCACSHLSKLSFMHERDLNLKPLLRSIQFQRNGPPLDLTLGKRTISYECFDCLGELLKFNRLSQLRLTAHTILMSSNFLEGIESTRSLVGLGLRSPLHDPCAISGALSKNRTIKSLEIYHPTFLGHRLASICKAISSMEQLSELKVGGTLAASDLVEIRNLVKKRNNIRKLVFGFRGRIECDEMVEELAVLIRQTNLTSLHLENDYSRSILVPQASAEKLLLKSLEMNTTLRETNIHHLYHSSSPRVWIASVSNMLRMNMFMRDHAIDPCLVSGLWPHVLAKAASIVTATTTASTVTETAADSCFGSNRLYWLIKERPDLLMCR